MNKHDATEQAFKNGYKKGLEESRNSFTKCEFCKHNIYNGGGCNRTIIIPYKTASGLYVDEPIGLDYCSNGTPNQ